MCVAEIKVKVTDINGNAVEGAEVTLTGINVENNTAITNSNGTAVFVYHTENVIGNLLNEITVSAVKNGMQSNTTKFGILVKGSSVTEIQNGILLAILPISLIILLERRRKIF